MEVITILIMLAPLGLVLWVANLADRRIQMGPAESGRALSALAYALLALLYAGLVFFGLMIQGTGLLAPQLLEGNPPIEGLDLSVLPRLGLSMWAPALVGLVLMMKPVRSLVDRFTDLDATRVVHGVSLSMSALVLVNLLTLLAMGLTNVAEMMEAQSAAGIAYNPVPGLWAQNIGFFVVSLFGVGWLARRTLHVSLERLGIVVPNWQHVAVGVLAAFLLVPGILLLENLAARVGVGADPSVERLTEQLVGPLTQSLPGILTLGLAAALGEESVFRGAMHPRFGLILTAVLFALLHSNYGITFSTVAVLLVGLILGVLRTRYNTTTTMVTHATYNMLLGIISYFGWLSNV